MKRTHHNKRRKVPVPVASMGDIAFLLIIFFMLLSEFAKDRDLRLDPPTYEHVEKSEFSVMAQVAVDADGEIYFEGERVENVKDVEWGVRALLANATSDDQRRVQFKCDRMLPREKFEPVLKAIAEGGGIIEAVGEKPSVGPKVQTP